MTPEDNPLNQPHRGHDGHRNTNPYGSASGDGNGGNEQGGDYGDDNLARQYGTVLPAEPAEPADPVDPAVDTYSARGASGNDRSYAAGASAPVSRGDAELLSDPDRTAPPQP